MALDFDDLDVAESACRYDSITEAELLRSGTHASGAGAISVKVLGGLSGDELCWVSVNRSTSIRALKACVAHRAQIPASAQRLFGAGVQLCDHEVLGDILPFIDDDVAEVGVIRASAARAKTLDDVKDDRVRLEDLEEELRNDAEIVLAALDTEARALKHAGQTVKQHKGVVLEAVRRDGGNLQYAADDLREQLEIVLAAVKQNGEVLVDVPEALRSDRQVVIAAVKQNGLVLKHVATDLQDDHDVVLAAVQQNGAALKHAGAEARRNRELILAAVKNSAGNALRHVDADMRASRGLMRAAVQLDGLALQHASSELRRDRSVVLAAVQSNGLALEHAAAHLQGDHQVVLKAVCQHGLALQWASSELCQDEAVAVSAIRQNRQAIRYVGTDVVGSPGFMAAAEETEIDEDLELDAFLAASPKAADKLRRSGQALFFDARTVEEFNKSHVIGAQSLPLDPGLMGPNMVRSASAHPDHVIFIYSDNGLPYSRDVLVARQLRRLLQNQTVLRLAGGLNLWKERGFPVEGDSSLMLLGAPIAKADLSRQLQKAFQSDHWPLVDE